MSSQFSEGTRKQLWKEGYLIEIIPFGITLPKIMGESVTYGIELWIPGDDTDWSWSLVDLQTTQVMQVAWRPSLLEGGERIFEDQEMRLEELDRQVPAGACLTKPTAEVCSFLLLSHFLRTGKIPFEEFEGVSCITRSQIDGHMQVTYQSPRFYLMSVHDTNRGFGLLDFMIPN